MTSATASHLYAEEKKDDGFDHARPTLVSTKRDSLSPRPSRDTPIANLYRSVSPCKRWTIILLRTVLLDVPVFLLFAFYIATVLLHKIHDEYLRPQLLLMKWVDTARPFEETTYYEHACDSSDITASSVEELLIPPNASSHEATEHLLIHGASMYPNLISTETASALREWIAVENYKREGWYVIQNDHRYSWGIDVNEHPALKDYWRELASNQQFVDTLTETMGPDPAIIEFTAITSSYGAKDQHDHQDVVPTGSAAKFARSFVPSYSLFIPLQDTTYDMGATHVCPGTHLCSQNAEEICPYHNLPLSGNDDGGVWKQGWGALVNQQTTHKGMGHFRKGALDRVVIIATFAPRPQTSRALETRLIGTGGSYSLNWAQWGHSFSDFANLEKLMTEPQKTLRSLGILKGKGWTLPMVASMRMINGEAGYNDPEMIDHFLSKGGFWFLPRSWQTWDSEAEEFYDEEIQNEWYDFVIGVLETAMSKLKWCNIAGFASFLGFYVALDAIVLATGRGKLLSILYAFRRLFWMYGLLIVMAYMTFHVIGQSNWGKDIKSGKAFRPRSPNGSDEDPTRSTLPNRMDILFAPQYTTDHMAAFGRIIDYRHPGNVRWKIRKTENARFYASLSPQLQEAYCEHLISSIRTEQRFLSYSGEHTWAVMDDDTVLQHFCHEELMAQRSPLLQEMARQLGSLKSEALHGRWRDSVIYKKYAPSYLDKLKEDFFPELRRRDIETLAEPSIQNPMRGDLRSIAIIPQAKVYQFVRQFLLPPQPVPKEPFQGAWLQEGDEVEAIFNCDAANGWFRGTIEFVLAAAHSVDIRYLGDNKIDENVSLSCVRRFKPYAVGEEVLVTDPDSMGADDDVINGHIVRVHGGGEWFDIQTAEEDVVTEVTWQRVGRPVEHDSGIKLNVGDHVMASFRGSEEFFPGYVAAVNEDRTFAIEYDDGDFERRVPRRMIHFLAH